MPYIDRFLRKRLSASFRRIDRLTIGVALLEERQNRAGHPMNATASWTAAVLSFHYSPERTSEDGSLNAVMLRYSGGQSAALIVGQEAVRRASFRSAPVPGAGRGVPPRRTLCMESPQCAAETGSLRRRDAAANTRGRVRSPGVKCHLWLTRYNSCAVLKCVFATSSRMARECFSTSARAVVFTCSFTPR